MITEWDEYLMGLEVGGYTQVVLTGSAVNTKRTDYERLTRELENDKIKWITVNCLDGNETFIRKAEIEYITFVCAAYVEQDHRKRREEAFKGE